MTKLSSKLELQLRESEVKFMEFKTTIQKSVNDIMTRTTQDIDQINFEIKKLAPYADF